MNVKAASNFQSSLNGLVGAYLFLTAPQCTEKGILDGPGARDVAHFLSGVP